MSHPADTFKAEQADRLLNRGNRTAGSTADRESTVSQGAGDTLPLAASIRLLLDRDAIWDARELLGLALRLHPDDPELLRIHEILAPPKVKKSPVQDHDRSSEFRWLKEEGARHQGFWVALEGEKLLAEASTLKELLAQLETIAPARPPLVHRIG